MPSQKEEKRVCQTPNHQSSYWYVRSSPTIKTRKRSLYLDETMTAWHIPIRSPLSPSEKTMIQFIES